MYRERLCADRRRAGTDRTIRPAADPRLEEVLGPLEHRVLEALWRAPSSVSVRDLQAELPGPADKTLMTTLDRLYRKGVLARAKDGRAFRYSPRYSPQALLKEVVRRTFARLLGRNRSAMRPVLSTLVDAVTEQDADALDELERLVRERRMLPRSPEGVV